MKDATSNLGFIFFPPDTQEIYGIAKVGKTYYIVKLDHHMISKLMENLKELYLPFGGLEFRSIRVPSYNELLVVFRKIVMESIRGKIYSRRSRKARKIGRLEPEYIVFKLHKGNYYVLIIFDLATPPHDLTDIPVAWNHKSEHGGLPEVYCLIIGYRSAIENLNKVTQDKHIYEGLYCPLTKIFRQLKSNGRSTKYLSALCKNVYRCERSETTRNRKMKWTDKFEYIINTSSISYINIYPRKEFKYGEEMLTYTTTMRLYKDVKVNVKLWGFKLELAKHPKTYLGIFKYNNNFILYTSIDNTNALEIMIDSRWLIFNYIYTMIYEDPYLLYITALKKLLIDETQAFIPPLHAKGYASPTFSISKLKRVIVKYLEDPNLFIQKLTNYVNRIYNIKLDDIGLINYIELISLHTFAHTIYNAFIQLFNSSPEELGLIIEKDIRKPDTDNDVYLSEIFRQRIYRLYIYEKADGGYGYLNSDLVSIKGALANIFESLRNIYSELDNRIIKYRSNIYNIYYHRIINKLHSLSDQDIDRLLNKIGTLAKTINTQLGATIGNYTLLPTWLIRYGVLTQSIRNINNRGRFRSVLWMLLASLYDLYWDVSPNDLVLNHECIYPDLVQHFTLSRRYAIHLLNDLISNIRYGKVIVSPFTTNNINVFEKVISGKVIVLFTPWIDEFGKKLLSMIRTRKHPSEVFLVTREQIQVSDNSDLVLPKYNVFSMDAISERPLHGKIYANNEGYILITSQNLTKTSLSRNIESYTLINDPLLSKGIIGLTKVLYNRYRSLEHSEDSS